MVIVIDNYDSFTYNLVQYLGRHSVALKVFRNDEISVEEIRAMQPRGIVISPGPCSPKEAGISVPVVEALHREFPILGVCLGHQAIGAAFGGRIIRAKRLVHGKVSAIRHDRKGVFKGIPNPFRATRYHSLVVEKASLPKELKISATSEEDDEIMGLRHRNYPKIPLEGVQFHPESILTEHGLLLVRNFLSFIRRWRRPKR